MTWVGPGWYHESGIRFGNGSSRNLFKLDVKTGNVDRCKSPDRLRVKNGKTSSFISFPPLLLFVSILCYTHMNRVQRQTRVFTFILIGPFMCIHVRYTCVTTYVHDLRVFSPSPRRVHSLVDLFSHAYSLVNCQGPLRRVALTSRRVWSSSQTRTPFLDSLDSECTQPFVKPKVRVRTLFTVVSTPSNPRHKNSSWTTVTPLVRGRGQLTRSPSGVSMTLVSPVPQVAGLPSESVQHSFCSASTQPPVSVAEGLTQ